MNAREELRAHLAHEAHDRVVNLARRGRWEQAEDELETWALLVPAAPEIPLMRARIRYHQGRRQEAMVELGQAAEAGAGPAEVERMRTHLITEDDRLVRRQAEREEGRKARQEFVSDMIRGLAGFFSALSPREVAYLAAVVIFTIYVLFMVPNS